MSNYAKLGQARFFELLDSYASAKDNLQRAIAAAVYQAVELGNPNWMTDLFNRAGFWGTANAGKNGDKRTVTADGRQVYAYLMSEQDDGGLGLGGILKLNRVDCRWEYTSKSERKFALEELDRVFLSDVLDTLRWDKFGKAKASAKAFNAQLTLDRMHKKLSKAIAEDQLDIESVNDALRTLDAIHKQLANVKKLRLAA